MNIFEIFRLECISAGLEIKNKADALQEVTRVAKKCHVLDNVSHESIKKSLEERENLGSTGFGKGIAIPHCRMTDVSEFVVGLITVPEGIDFDAIDGEKVHIIFFIIGPLLNTNEHIRILSILSRTLNIPGVADEILGRNNPESIYESFLRYIRDHVDTKDHKAKQLLHVFVQDKDIFEDILQVFASVETSSMAIIEGKNSREYLSKMPLFAGFWGDSYLGVNRIITAVIDKSLTNEILRNIENLTGSLDKRTDIMATVQDIFYTAGSLEA